MTETEIGLLILTLGLVLSIVHILGSVAVKLRQPRLVGEILAGVLLGPFVLGRFAPEAFEFLFANPAVGADKTKAVLGFVYWLGVLLLMFVSGSHVKRLLSRENRRETAWIVVVGTSIPFLAVLALGWGGVLPLDAIAGERGGGGAVALVLASAAAVTSIPVISRILQELGILHTRFASLILGAAVLEDVLLWTALSVATAMAAGGSATDSSVVADSTRHVLTALGYMGLGLFVSPALVGRLRSWRGNILYRASPLAFAIIVLFAYIGVAALLGVNLVFAAFLAGFGLAGGIAGNQREHFSDAFDAVNKVSLALFVPIYFALVGYRLDFGREFSFVMFASFLIGSSLLAVAARTAAARLAGFRGLDAANIAVTSNARGGPGIVLASVALDAAIINSAFYTTLVLTAIVTSQLAGMWLQYVLSRGWPLLSTSPEDGPLLEQGGAVGSPPLVLRPQTA